jgi:hypothetical protein
LAAFQNRGGVRDLSTGLAVRSDAMNWVFYIIFPLLLLFTAVLVLLAFDRIVKGLTKKPSGKSKSTERFSLPFTFETPIGQRFWFIVYSLMIFFVFFYSRLNSRHHFNRLDNIVLLGILPFLTSLFFWRFSLMFFSKINCTETELLYSRPFYPTKKTNWLDIKRVETDRWKPRFPRDNRLGGNVKMRIVVRDEKSFVMVLDWLLEGGRGWLVELIERKAPQAQIDGVTNALKSDLG